MILIDGKGSICSYSFDAKAAEMTITSDGGLFFLLSAKDDFPFQLQNRNFMLN